ncbi:MAG: GGDEF domain-containing response regulator [Chloroflexi bacterium]|nr:MAG: GGDEF domain-containing response regulator [Chloroflexota bacterium]
MAGRPLRVLILEDRPEDADLARHELHRAGYDLNWRRVDDEAGFKANVDPELDLILADYHQPQFNAIRALKIMQDMGLDIPFVIVSGAIGEDLAVAAVRLGATDYVLKDRLARLGTAVKNAIEQGELRRRQRVAQAALEHHALHDGLTDLPNRLMLREEIQKAIGTNADAVLLLLDIDNFKEVNDSFGHQLGDVLLRQMGARLREPVDGAHLIARLGGDEFGILLPGGTVAVAERTAHAILRALEQPFLSDDHALEITASIGIAAFPDHATDAETLLRRADVAMYGAKRTGGTYAVYRQEDDPYDASRLLLRADLRRAIDHQEITLYYQPQVTLATGELTGLEALARWRHAERGWIPPTAFIPVAEHMGLIKPLTLYLAELAGRDAMTLSKTGVDLAVAVNVSMRNLLDAHFPEMLEDVVARTGQPAERLKLEITESAVMAEPGRVLDSMKRLRSAGIRFSIDDFGTGYSSLAYLQRLPVEEIKIDRSFVGHMIEETGSTAIVRATIELGGSLGLDVVAEGVEDEPTWQALKRMGCSAAQGYFIGRPMPVGELAGWMRNWSGRSRAAA